MVTSLLSTTSSGWGVEREVLNSPLSGYLKDV